MKRHESFIQVSAFDGIICKILHPRKPTRSLKIAPPKRRFQASTSSFLFFLGFHISCVSDLFLEGYLKKKNTFESFDLRYFLRTAEVAASKDLQEEMKPAGSVSVEFVQKGKVDGG